MLRSKQSVFVTAQKTRQGAPLCNSLISLDLFGLTFMCMYAHCKLS